MSTALSRFPPSNASDSIRRPAVLLLIAAVHVLVLWAISRSMPAQEFEHTATALMVRILTPQAEPRPEPPPIELPRPSLPTLPRLAIAAPVIEAPAPTPVVPVDPVAPRSAEPLAVAAASTAPVKPAASAPTEIRPAPVERQIAITQVEYLSPPVLVYPLAARRSREQGAVHVRVRVDERGHPDRLVVVRSSGAARLDEAALATVRATRFKPYTEDGVARPFWVVMPLVFELET